MLTIWYLFFDIVQSEKENVLWLVLKLSTD